MTKLFLGIATGRGMGFSTAKRFHKEGYDVVMSARHPANLEPLAAELRQQAKGNVTVEQIDAADPEAVAALVEKYSADLEVLHYNGGSIRIQTLQDQPADTVHSDININLTSALTAIKAALVPMSDSKRGTILLTGGGVALTPMAGAMTLSVGKVALRSLAETLFAPLAESGVHIATVTVNRGVEAGSAVADSIGAAFWTLHAQNRADWTWETVV
ncbi:MAG: short-chain dehydrogenase [Hyphomicrobiales bacterium]|nr:short-chain dehydrogenase [Hyphomicrobiales bacterium]